MKKLGDQIKQLRFKKGITQEALADSVGVTKASISNYECNHRNPPYNILCAIAKTLEVDSDELLEYMTSEKKQNTSKNDKTDGKRPRRVKKLLDAFYKLTDEAQLKAIERVEELGMIPEYRLGLAKALQQYISNRCRLTYTLCEDTSIPTPYGSEFMSDSIDNIDDVRRITFYNGTKKNETLYWTFYCYDPEVIVDAETLTKIFTSVYADLPFEPYNNLAFAFFDQNIFDTFYGCYEDQQEMPELDYEPRRTRIPALFLLLDKETLQVKDVIDYDPNKY